MKNKFLIPLLTLFLVFSVQPIFAETGTTTTTPKTTRNQERKEIREEKKEELKATISEAKQKRIQTIYDALKNGLEKRHASLIKIKDKLQARITKNPMNKKTEEAQKILDNEFKTAESKYQSDLIALDKKFAELKTSTKASDLVQGLKDSVKLVREDLNAIKKALKLAITTLAKAPKLEVTKTN